MAHWVDVSHEEEEIMHWALIADSCVVPGFYPLIGGFWFVFGEDREGGFHECVLFYHNNEISFEHFWRLVETAPGVSDGFREAMLLLWQDLLIHWGGTEHLQLHVHADCLEEARGRVENAQKYFVLLDLLNAHVGLGLYEGLIRPECRPQTTPVVLRLVAKK